MLILGIESTAHTFGAGIVTEEGKVTANIIDSYTSEDGGMVPDKVAEHHNKVAEEVLHKTLEKSGINRKDTQKDIWKEIEFIAYSAGPGLDPALWAGYNKVKEWGKRYNKRLVGVNHCAAHLSIGKVYNKLKDPCYLYVSGVNTQIIVYDGGKYRVIGETLDIGLGNMLDKFGRMIGLGFPAGAKIEELAKKGKYVELPYTVKGMDVSFSGILTKVEQILRKKTTWKEIMQKQGKNIDMPYVNEEENSQNKINKNILQQIQQRIQTQMELPITKEDLCFSIQETCFAMLTEVVERAMANTGKDELLLVGGVGANKRFCEMLQVMCSERDARFYKVPIDLAGDQGAMIAWEGFLRKAESGDIGVKPHWRVDEV